jgi:hypothetical protein
MASLVDLLAQKTEKITQLLVEKRFNEEYESCKEDIKQIQAAIAYRKEFFLQDP